MEVFIIEISKTIGFSDDMPINLNLSLLNLQNGDYHSHMIIMLLQMLFWQLFGVAIACNLNAWHFRIKMLPEIKIKWCKIWKSGRPLYRYLSTKPKFAKLFQKWSYSSSVMWYVPFCWNTMPLSNKSVSCFHFPVIKRLIASVNLCKYTWPSINRSLMRWSPKILDY